MSLPLLLLDVDGVLPIFGFAAHHRPPGRYLLVDGIPHFVSARAGEQAAALADAFELVWCTGWEEKADEYLPAALGLPRGLGHLSFPRTAAADRHWKLAAIDAFAGPARALAWVDDAHDETCHAWAGGRPGPTLLVTTDPAVGLTAPLAQQLRAWAAGLG